MIVPDFMTFCTKTKTARELAKGSNDRLSEKGTLPAQSAKLNVSLIVGLLCLGCVWPLGATTIFDNSVNDLVTRFDPRTNEVGDEILLAGTDRYLSAFSFEFWGTNTASPTSFAGDVEARVRFYENNGTLFHGYATPGTMFFDSGWFSVPSPTERSTFVFTEGSDFPAGGQFIPDSITNMTWSVQFEGLDATDSAGVDIYSPPVAGGDYPDYWEYDGGGWRLLTNTVPMNFAARMDAHAAIPEPSSLALSLVVGLGLLTMVRRLR
jgi:hypothetical protein